MKLNKSVIALAIPIVIIIVALVFLLLGQDKSSDNVMVGMFETTTVNVASEIPGRIEEIMVDPGDKVEKGQVIATLEANIMEAKLNQARGFHEAASSLVKRAKKGVREEEIKAAKNQYEMAKSQFEFAEKTYNRFTLLYADSIISTQEMDEMKFKYNAAQQEMEAAESIWVMAKKGATDEEIGIVEGELTIARGMYDEAEAFYAQLEIIAPVSGEISARIGEEGEVMAAGYPIITIMRPEKTHAILNVREDKLSHFKIGSRHMGTVPGLNNDEIELEVSFISVMADFATWVPTRSKGEFDLKTFEVELKPVKQNRDLRPGMTVQIKL